MPRSGKTQWWQLILAVVLLVLAAEYLVGARRAGRTLVFVPDQIGGLGDTWMWPGQAYFFSGLCTVGAIWLLVRFLRRRTP